MKNLSFSWAGTLLLLFSIFFSHDVQAQDCVLKDECYKFVYNGYTIKSESTVTLSFTVTVECSNALSYIAFQLPEGSKAGTPKNSNSNFKYTIENGTNEPFYSFKFQASPAEEYRNGASDTFTYTLTLEEFERMSTIMVQAKGANTVGTVEFNAKGCLPVAPCEKPKVSFTGPSAVCNLSDTTYTYNVEAPEAGVKYSFALPEGFVRIDSTLTSINFMTEFLEEEQLNKKYTVSVTATNTCGIVIASKEVLVQECELGETLPVTLTRFDGVSTGGGIKMSWETATEINNERFEVERSTNGKEFFKVGEVKGNGSSSIAFKYNFTDRQPPIGALYYRLRQVDFNGISEYSKVIAVESKVLGSGSFKVTLFPNPGQGAQVSAKIEGLPQSAGEVTLRVVDLSGRVLHTANLHHGSPEMSLGLGSVGLKPGMYLVSLSVDGQSAVQRLVIL